MPLSKITHAVRCLLGIVFLGLLAALSYIYPLTLGKSNILYSDYGKFYHSQRNLLQGKEIYSPVFYIKKTSKANGMVLAGPKSNPKKIIRLGGNLNPPFFTLISFPFAYLPYESALLLWTLLSMLAGYCSILGIQYKLDPLSLHSLPNFLLLLIAFSAYYPTFVSLQFGQVSLMLLPLLVLGWAAAHDQKSVTAAVFLGLAASLKPFIALFLVYFLIRKEWRALLVFTLTILACGLIAAAFFGSNTYYSYYQTCHRIAWAAANWNVSIYGMLLRLIGGPETNVALIPLQHFFTAAYISLSSLFLVALCWFLRPLKGKSAADLPQKTDLDFSIILTTMLLLSPLGWMYYFTFLSIPILVLWSFAKKGFYPVALPLLLATLLLMSNIPISLVSTDQIKTNNSLSIFLGSLIYFASITGLMAVLFAMRRCLKKLHIQNFERISPGLLLLIYSVVFFPSVVGILKSSNSWIRYAAGHTKESTPISHQD